jgi:hypothetical protein
MNKPLMELAQELNAPDFTVFVHWSGHVKCYSVRVVPGGWHADKELEVDDSGMFETEAAAVRFLLSLHAAYREQEAANV